MTIDVDATRIANATISDGETPTVVVTLQMIRRGVEEFFAWNPAVDEPEALVVAVYCAMVEASSD